MKIKITREGIFSALVILPYLESGFVRHYFDIYFSDNAYIRAIVLMLLLVSTVFFVFNMTRRQGKIRYYEKALGCFSIVALSFLLMQGSDLTASVCMWLWVCAPLFFAMQALRFFRMESIDLGKVLINMIRWFTLYVTTIIVYYTLFQGLLIGQERLSSRGGGPVIFGYTIAVFFALCLHLKDRFKKREYYLILVILTIGALETKTRGSVWPVVFCWILNFLFTRLTVRKLMVGIIASPLFILLTTVDISSIFSATTHIGWERLLNLHSFRRSITLLGIFDVFGGIPVSKKLFGYGIGGFFPYQRWTVLINDVNNNMFNWNGHTLLVQPHNSFVYFLMETGIVGVAIILSVFVFSVLILNKHRESTFAYQIIFIGVMFVVNCVDSVFLVQPGVASIFWMLLFLVIEEHIQNVSKKRQRMYGESQAIIEK